MSGPYDRDDREEIEETSAADREISLGTGAMLGIFFALVLVCGAFFGFGYSMGHKSTPVTGAPGAMAAAAEGDSAAGGTKDSSTGADSSTGQTDAPAVVVAPSGGTKTSAGRTSGGAATSVDVRRDASAATGATKDGVKPFITVPKTTPPVTSAAAPVSAPAPVAGGTVFVQISAVSHQEDAQALIGALKRRGYNATVRHEPADALLHIQMGPYATKKDAEAMKQQLGADGYNAILK